MEHPIRILKYKGPDGIWHSGADMSSFSAFEDKYIDIRRQEQRIFSIGEIRRLPEVSADHIHAREWRIRKRSIRRFQRYLQDKPSLEAILDIGCGNGFFTNILSRYAKSVTGIDVNLTELRQASEAFEGNPVLKWYYADVLDTGIFGGSLFDVITFCCSFQYFSDIEKILERCSRLLKPRGSVHILESPFYETGREQAEARERTIRYYERMGMKDLSQYYFHHSWDAIKRFRPVVHYREKRGWNRIFSIAGSPFPWLEIPNNILMNVFGNR